MKATALFISFLLFTVSYSVDLSNKISSLSMTASTSSNRFKSLMRSPLGSLIAEMAQLHTELGGPIDELVNAISELFEDIELQTNNAISEFNLRTEAHNREVSRIGALIDSAVTDVNTFETKLGQHLYPLKQSLEGQIEELKHNIENNRNSLKNENERRDSENKVYNERMGEHQSALEALEEALNIVQSLANSNPSLLQINKAKNSVKNLERKLKFNKGEWTPLIEALVQITVSQNFANQETVSKILDLLRRIKSNVEVSRDEYISQEKSAVAAYKAEVQRLEGEHVNFVNNLAARESDLKSTIAEIASSEAFLAKRRNDLAGYQADLKAENENYANIQKIHVELLAQLEHEKSVVQEASQILQGAYNAGPDYLRQRSNAF